MKKIFELDAAVPDAELGIGLLWKGLEVDRDRRHHHGTGPQRRARRRVRRSRGSRPAAAAGGRARPHRVLPLDRRRDRRRTTTGRTPWLMSCRAVVRAGHAESRRPRLLFDVPLDPVLRNRRLSWPGGSRTARNRSRSRQSGPCLTGLSWSCCTQSDGMRTRRRKDTGDPHAERLPDTLARLITFTITATTRSGRAKTTRMRVLTTLLDHAAFPAADIAVLYAERWQIEIAFLHLKKTVPRSPRPLRGQSPELARQEAWALLLIHNMTATAAARASGSAGIDPRARPVHRRPRPHPLPCRRRGTVPALRPPARQALGQPERARSSPCPAIAGAASGPPAEPPPNAGPGTPRKSPTPSRSQSRISQNGTLHRKLKGSGIQRDSPAAV